MDGNTWQPISGSSRADSDASMVSAGISNPAHYSATAGDTAISLAAQWCRAARELTSPASVMAFGTPDSAYLLIGEARRLCLHRYQEQPLRARVLWERLEEFCQADQFVAGYVGFDAVWADGASRPTGPIGAAASPTLHFWEPEAVIRIDAEPGCRPRVSVLRYAPLLEVLRPRPLEPGVAIGLASFDRESPQFGASVARTIKAIRRGESERLTLARRVDLPDDLDLLSSFAVPPTSGDLHLTRSFYLATPTIEIAGHSPELLARGDSRRFVCYKLSGTGPRHHDSTHDARLRAELLADSKVLQEHSLSLQATRRALGTLGHVSAGPMEVMDRRGLRHLMTPLTVDLNPGIAWSALMQALVPTGAAPRESALSALDQIEPGSRGAYYGVIGLRTPEGNFEFSQVLRSLIRDGSGVHTFVGAAVTGQSTEDGESAETRLKLDDIVAVRTIPPGRPAGMPTTE